MIDYGLTLHLNFREKVCYVLLTSDQDTDKLIRQFDLGGEREWLSYQN
jgi:hypothetical protein